MSLNASTLEEPFSTSLETSIVASESLFSSQVGLHADEDKSVLVILAPKMFSNAECEQLLDRYQWILDLRNHTENYVIEDERFSDRWICLAQVFQEFKSQQDNRADTKEKVRSAIEEISVHRMLMPQIRPMGWDDICA